MNQAIIRTSPQYAALDRGFGDGENCAVKLNAGIVTGDRAASPLLLVLIVSRQVRADDLPGLSAVTSSLQSVARVIDDGVIVWRDHDWRRPLKTVFEIFRTVSTAIVRINANMWLLACALVVARQVTEILTGINNVRGLRVCNDKSSLATADRTPITLQDSAGMQAVARTGTRSEVLQTAHDPIRRSSIDTQVIKLADWNRWAHPGLSAVPRQSDTGITRAGHALRILRVDPDIVMVPAP